MLIVADEEIPCVEYYFASYGDLIVKPGRSLMRSDVVAADILLVRSVTQVNAALLHDTQIKYVGSTVTGTDHLDVAWLNKAGIPWDAALGCNALAVAEYVVTVVAALQKQGLFLQKNRRAGVVGVGRIGSKVVEKLKILGFEVIQCDPIRAQEESDFVSTPIEEFAELDFILLHTPLTHDGLYPTYHLIEKNFLQRQKKDCVLLNAGRGSVINFTDLLRYGRHLIWCLDVWENEPKIDLEVLRATTLASPHIAGHSVQSKYRGIDMIYKAAVQRGILVDKAIASAVFPTTEISFADKSVDWRDVVLTVFNPTEVTQLMKKAFLTEGDGIFDELRKRFKRGYEFEFVKIKEYACSTESLSILQDFLEEDQ